jgi:hypothetical protein
MQYPAFDKFDDSKEKKQVTTMNTAPWSTAFSNCTTNLQQIPSEQTVCHIPVVSFCRLDTSTPGFDKTWGIILEDFVIRIVITIYTNSFALLAVTHHNLHEVHSTMDALG